MQLARARQCVLVIDSGLPRNRFAEQGHGFFAQDGKPAYTSLRDAAEQVFAYPTAELLKGTAKSAHQAEGSFVVSMTDGCELRAVRLILATGVRDELPAITGIEERWGRTVLHCPYCHGFEFSGQPLGVLASHPMAGHQATLLPDWGPTTLFTQDIFEPSPEELTHLESRGVKIERSPVVELLGQSPKLEAVRLADGRTIAMNAMFTQPKTHMASPLAEQLGCVFIDGPSGQYLLLDDWKQSSVPGVFAAGDMAAPFHNASLAAAPGSWLEWPRICRRPGNRRNQSESEPESDHNYRHGMSFAQASHSAKALHEWSRATGLKRTTPHAWK